jgi:hypothetical protein
VVRAVAALVLPVAASAVLVPLRGEVDNASVVLVLALVVVAVATLGGRWPTALAAISAAVSFDLLHTDPFGSLVVHGADDLLKTGLLVVVGLVAASLVAGRVEAEAALAERRNDLRRVRDVTRASERSPQALVERLELELTLLLDLETAAFVRGESDDTMPRITSEGVHIPPGAPPLHPAVPASWSLELPVSVIDRQLGRFVLRPARPTSGARLPAGRRDLALTWADQLGFALDRHDRNDAAHG